MLENTKKLKKIYLWMIYFLEITIFYIEFLEK